MRLLILTLVLTAGSLGLMALAPGQAHAQFYPYPGVYNTYGNYAPMYPYSTIPPAYQFNYGTQWGPSGYRSFSNYSTMPDAFGNSYYQYNYSYSNPYRVGPYHSIYWDPYRHRYINGPGTMGWYRGYAGY